MHKIGMIACQTSHSDAYLDLFNSVRPKGFATPISGARVMHVWDYNLERARQFAQKYGVENVERLPEDVIEKSDLLLIMSDDKEGIMGVKDHLPLARLCAEMKRPAFIDKPLTNSVSEAEEILGLRKTHGFKVMSFSAYHSAPKFLALKEKLSNFGELQEVSVWVNNGASVRYGIHASSILCTLVDEDPVSIRTEIAGKPVLPDWPRSWVVSVRFPSDLHATLTLCYSKEYCYGAEVMGYEKTVRCQYGSSVEENFSLYERQMRQFLHFVETGAPHVTMEESLRALKVILGAEKSFRENREVAWKEIV